MVDDTRTDEQGTRQPSRHIALAALGLGCWIATLLLYSNAITPFQRFAGISTFMGEFALQVLGIATAASLVLTVAALFGRFVPRAVLHVGGGALHVAAAAGFGVACLTGIPDDMPVLVWVVSAASALGGVGTGLVWGRAFKGFSPRASLAAVALAAAVAAVLGVLAVATPPAVCVGLFVAEALAAAVLPAAVGCREPGCEEAAAVPAGSCGRPVAKRLRSFTGVAAQALIGLLVFAFVMGTMRGLIVDTFSFRIVVLPVCAVILGAFSFGRARRPLTRTAYHSLIPTFAVLLLAVTNVTSVLGTGSSISTACVFLLYTLAALLTLATLAAIAHADEFPCDLVFSSALMMFSATSLAGVGCAGFMSDEAIGVSTTVITTAYAFAMAIVTRLRAEWAPADGDGEDEERAAFDGPCDRPEESAAPDGGPTDGRTGAARHTASHGGGSRAASSQQQVRTAMEDRCAQLARDHRLTPREAEILTYLAEGHGSGYIGEALYISPNTVRTHVHNLYRKLGVSSREEIIELTRR